MIIRKIFLIIFGLGVVLNAQNIVNTIGGKSATDKFIVENIDNEAGLIVTGEGKIGIGITDPGGLLHIRQYGDDSKQLVVGSVNQPSLEWFFRVDNSANLSLNNEGLTTASLYIGNTGKVGIGTTTPTEELDLNGSMNLNGEVYRKSTTGSANLVPIAYGYIYSDGTISTGTGNFTCSKLTSNRYEITITNVNYWYGNYITIVTPSTGFANSNSSSGKLIVDIFDNTGSQIKGYFQFVTYKP